MSFSYMLKIKIGVDNTGLNLKVTLQDKDGTAVTFSDGDSSKMTGIVEQGVGDYSFWTDQWPDESFPFTAMILDASDDSLLTTADFNALDFLAGTGGTSSSPTQSNRRWNSLPVDEWRRIIGYHPFHFWGMADNTIIPITSSCNSLVYQYAWQAADQLGREEIRESIVTAENRLMEYLNYYPGRHFVEETLQYPRPQNAGQQYAASRDGQGRWLAVKASEGHIRNIGVERYTIISAAQTVFYSDEDGDALEDTATVTVATTITNPDQIGLYFAMTDRLNNDGVSEKWRIAPANISISGGIATITAKKWMFAKPIKYEGFSTMALDPSVSANFVTSVDVYRRWCDPDGLTTDDAQAVLIWETEPYPAWAFCCSGTNDVSFSTNARDPAAVAFGLARAGIRDARLGEISVGGAVYDSTTGEWIGADWGICRQPDRVILRYEAGAPLSSMENTQYLSAKDGDWDETIARLAAADMPRQICACDLANRKLYYWQFDLARSAGANDEQYRIGDRNLNNPIGTLRGQVYAWNRIIDRQISRSITI